MAETTQSPSTIVSDSSAGSVSWSNPSNAASDDSSYAQATMVGATTTEYLKATNFGFNVPSGSTINGIEVLLERSSTLGRGSDHTIQLVKGGSVSGNNKASQTWPASEATYTYGGSSDLWGLSLSDTDINASGFGATVRAQSSSNAYANVDHIEITVYYTPPATSDVIKQTMYYSRMRTQ